MKRQRALFFLLGIFIPSLMTTILSAADTPSLRLIDVNGSAWIWGGEKAGWAAALNGNQLMLGAKLRVDAPGFVELSADEHRMTLLRLEGGAQITYLHDNPKRFSLDQGLLWLRQEAASTTPPVRVLTQQFLVQIENGGISIESRDGKAVLRVFGDNAKVYRKIGTGYDRNGLSVTEGMRWSPEAGSVRMNFDEYIHWARWYKQSDESKDKLRLYS